jgi:hypothetical protein
MVGAQMRVVRGIGDQLLGNVIARAAEQKIEAERLAQARQVLQRVVDQPAGQQHDQNEHDRLQGQRTIAPIIDQHRQSERRIVRARISDHVLLPVSGLNGRAILASAAGAGLII